MADGTQEFMFSFGPLSGLADIANGLPGTEFPNVFNSVYPGVLKPGDPATTDGASNPSGYTQGRWGAAAPFTWNGAVGLINNVPYVDTIYDILEGVTATVPSCLSTTCTANTATVILNTPNQFDVGAK